MKSLAAAGVLSSLLLFQLLIGCTGYSSNGVANNHSTASTNNADSNSARTNVEELGVLVAMPFETEDVVWKEIPHQKKVVAVLRFSPSDANKLVEEAAKLRKPAPVDVISEVWFPPELIAQSETSGDGNLRGIAYAANSFYQPPYTDGQITRIQDTDYFVLELNAR
jgi:hypothetical protein